MLYRPFCWDRNDEQSPGEDPYFELPAIHDVAGTPRVFYMGWYITDAQRHPQVPRLTAEQREAMELVESIANDPAFHLEMDFQPGDVQLLDNGRILHRPSEAYQDDPDPGPAPPPPAPLAGGPPVLERRGVPAAGRPQAAGDPVVD